MAQYRSIFIWIMALWTLQACAPENQQKEAIRPVRFQKVISASGGKTRTFTGTTKAGIASNLSFKVSGNIAAVNVEVGDKVRSGQTLMTLDPTDYQLQYEDTRQALRGAAARLKNASSHFSRIEDLYESGSVSLADFENAKTAQDAADAQRSSLQKRLELLSVQIGYTRLKAPLDGTIVAVNNEVGEVINVGTPVLFLNAKEFDPEVTIAIPDVMISKVNSGDQVRVQISATENKSFNGVVTEIGVPLGLQTTYPVTVKIKDKAGQIRPGMAADVIFEFDGNDAVERYLIRSTAVGEDQDGIYVYKLNMLDSVLAVAERTEVAVGDLTNEGIEVLSGIEEDQLIVTAGVSKITNGMKVKLFDGK